MAGKGLTIPLSLDPREWLRGIKVVERSLEGMEDDLDEVERAGDKLERALEDNFKDAARAAERAGRDMDDGLQKGFSQTGFGVVAAEAGDEFVQSFGEAVRAGDPSEAIYETVTNAAQIAGAAFPGAGTIIGLGISAVAGMIKGIQEREAEVRAAIADLVAGSVDDAIDAGEKAGLGYAQALYGTLDDETGRRESLQGFFPEAETFTEALDMAVTLANDLGVEFDVVGDLITGNISEQQAANNVLTTQADILQNQINKAYEDANGSMDNMTLEQQKQVSNWVAQRDGINTLIGRSDVMIDSTRRVGDQLSTWEGYARETSVQLQAARDAVNSTRPPDMSQSAWNAERMAAAAITTKATLQWIRDNPVAVGGRVAGATGAGGTTV